MSVTLKFCVKKPARPTPSRPYALSSGHCSSSIGDGGLEKNALRPFSSPPTGGTTHGMPSANLPRSICTNAPSFASSARSGSATSSRVGTQTCMPGAVSPSSSYTCAAVSARGMYAARPAGVTSTTASERSSAKWTASAASRLLAPCSRYATACALPTLYLPSWPDTSSKPSSFAAATAACRRRSRRPAWRVPSSGRARGSRPFMVPDRACRRRRQARSSGSSAREPGNQNAGCCPRRLAPRRRRSPAAVAANPVRFERASDQPVSRPPG
mmetsp:Transcript_25653/g.75937  ORF Transcript_25653/g.75937 Transcript_25653/m.75937 type:complete len:270 (-) Transcript_25653:156-965(-)